MVTALALPVIAIAIPFALVDTIETGPCTRSRGSFSKNYRNGSPGPDACASMRLPRGNGCVS